MISSRHHIFIQKHLKPTTRVISLGASVNSHPRRFPFDTTDRHEIICPRPSCKEGSRNKYLVWPAFMTGSSQLCADNQQRSDPLTRPDLPRTFLILKRKVPHSGKPLRPVQTDGWPPMCYTVHVWCGAGEQQVARTRPQSQEGAEVLSVAFGRDRTGIAWATLKRNAQVTTSMWMRRTVKSHWWL